MDAPWVRFFWVEPPRLLSIWQKSPLGAANCQIGSSHVLTCGLQALEAHLSTPLFREAKVMVKLYGPLMSLDASGTIGDAVTFSKWKGRHYARERVIPANPRSGAQVGRRAMFTQLTRDYSNLSGANLASWQPLADQLVASKFNAFLSENMKNWHNFLAYGLAYPVLRDDTVGVSTPDSEKAEWEENRILIEFPLSTANDNWSTMIFASKTSGFNTAVGNCIIVASFESVKTYSFYWTPPEVRTWYINYRLGSKHGAIGAEIGELTAVPP